MNWVSMWEDKHERAAESPPPNRGKLDWTIAAPSYRVDPRMPRPFARRKPDTTGPHRSASKPTAHDTARSLTQTRQYEHEAQRLETWTREYANGLRAWHREIRDVEPLAGRR